MTEGSTCPLCGSEKIELFLRERKKNNWRDFWICPQCALVFVPEGYHLSEEEEKARYLLHNNTPENKGYREFLSRILVPLKEVLPAPARGLDFGCGPGPVLAGMLREEGYETEIYDPFFANNPEVLQGQGQYDFITASEVAEHLRQPGEELKRLRRLLRPGGVLAVMTALRPGENSNEERDAFSQWFYTNDSTHISFFCETTMRWIARRWGGEIIRSSERVVLFRFQ